MRRTGILGNEILRGFGIRRAVRGGFRLQGVQELFAVRPLREAGRDVRGEERAAGTMIDGLDSMNRRQWIAAVGVLLLAIAGGGWLGVRYSEARLRNLLAESPKPPVDQALELRRHVLGEWIEEMPVKHGSVPLIGRSWLELKGDGSYRERVCLLAPDQTEVRGMVWATLGTWKADESHLEFTPTSQTGPTSRPTVARRCLATFGDGELSLYDLESPDRGEESHDYRRPLGKVLGERDLEGAREDVRDEAEHGSEP
jgi:hypothetical protein